MRVNVKFLSPMMKNGKIRKVGETLEIDATQAILLAKRGGVEIPNYTVEQEEQTVLVDKLIPEEAAK